MAEIIYGLATSHSPNISTPVDKWHLHVDRDFAKKDQHFRGKYYTIEELKTKKHNYELCEADYLTLCLDYKQSGVGSNSCGPELLPQYRMNDEEFCWKFRMSFV